MTATLTVSPKATPFPFAAVAIASYTQKAEVVYDESAATLSLDLDGSKFSSESDAVKALATAGGLAEDSAKVRASSHKTKINMITYTVIAKRRHPPISPSLAPSPQKLLSPRSWLASTPWTITSLTAHI